MDGTVTGARRDIPWQPIAGPADRTTFFAAQARYRRQTLRFTLVVFLAIALMGIPLSIAVAPLIYALAYLANDVGHWMTALPPWLVAIGQAIEPALDGKFELLKAIPFDSFVRLALLVVVPGFVGMFLVFLVTERVVRRGTIGGVLLRIGARAPRADDLEERQLVNVVQEMAIASGLPAPRVLLLDQPFANAAVVGHNPSDAVILVSRGTLDCLDRDETQGIIAHLIAQIGNGDLRVLHRLLSLSQTMIAGGLWIAAPFGKVARKTLFRLIIAAIYPTQKLSEEVGAALLTDKTLDTSDATQRNAFMTIVMFPVLLLRLSTLAGEMGYNMTRVILFNTYITPRLSKIWVARKLLADATSVQLTRNPDGLARAFARMSTFGGFTKELVWAGPLFVLGPSAVGQWSSPSHVQPALAMADGRITIPTSPPALSIGGKNAFGSIGAWDGGIPYRMNRLAYLGAHVGIPGGASRAGWRFPWGILFTIPFTILFLVIEAVMIGMSLILYSIGLVPLVALIHVLIVNGIPWVRARVAS